MTSPATSLQRPWPCRLPCSPSFFKPHSEDGASPCILPQPSCPQESHWATAMSSPWDTWCQPLSTPEKNRAISYFSWSINTFRAPVTLTQVTILCLLFLSLSPVTGSTSHRCSPGSPTPCSAPVHSPTPGNPASTPHSIILHWNCCPESQQWPHNWQILWAFS